MITWSSPHSTKQNNWSRVGLRYAAGDLLCTMKDPLLAIDFGEFKVTFDINCLTLPSDQDVDPQSLRKPAFLRSLSNQSQGSSAWHSECEADETQSTSASTEFAWVGDSYYIMLLRTLELLLWKWKEVCLYSFSTDNRFYVWHSASRSFYFLCEGGFIINKDVNVQCKWINNVLLSSHTEMIVVTFSFEGPLGHLPVAQREAVMLFKEKVKSRQTWSAITSFFQWS